MDRVPSPPQPSTAGSSARIVAASIAVASLALATHYLIPPGSAADEDATASSLNAAARVQVFNAATGTGMHGVAPSALGADASTNRTLWHAVSTRDFHAGLQRVETGAGIPAHSHETEEVVIITGGRGQAVDADGNAMEVGPGSMLHLERGARHEIRNVGEQPLWLAWVFPVRVGGEKFKFQQEYKTGVRSKRGMREGG